MKSTLTKRQSEVLEFIKKYINTNGYPPSVREIARGINLRSPATVHFHLNKLENLNYIKREPSKTRAITVLNW